ncbi:MAG: hypothetical protein BA872_02840 [Desulfobacterales bacterium C00003060]|nr:MAG: hypothetical protein BA872_02840 [Desulfobacterales bacterium C00003060]
MSWRKVQIAEFLDDGGIDILTGPFGTQLKASHYTSEGTPVINVRNVGYGDLRPEKLEFIPDQVVSRLSKHLLETRDIVFGRKGAVDRHLFVSESETGWMQGSDCIRIRVLTDAIYPAFLSFALRLPSHKQWMLTQCSNKATMASLNQDVIGRIPVNLPDPATQAEIASILSAYDDLIENNRRRIQLLEQAARLLYREWFVYLRFPGHEHVSITDGVPEGWTPTTIPDIGRVVTGKTPSKKKKSYYGDDIPFIKTPDIHGNTLVIKTDESLSEEGANTQANKTLPSRSILVSCIGTVGAVALNSSIAQTNQQINAIVPTNESLRYWTLFMAKDLKPVLEGMGGGSTMANVNKSKFSNIKVVIPSSLMLDQFNSFVAIQIDQIEQLVLMNLQLIQARDLLLTRMMNGKVAV